MALKKLSSRSDNKVKFPFENAYHKINSIKFENSKITIGVKVYADRDARLLDVGSNPMMGPMNNDVHISEKNYSCELNALPSATLKTLNESDRIKHVCYLYLREQDDFRTASNVMETGQEVAI